MGITSFREQRFTRVIDYTVGHWLRDSPLLVVGPPNLCSIQNTDPYYLLNIDAVHFTIKQERDGGR